MSSERFKLTDTSISKRCPLTQRNERPQRIHWDNNLRGFGIVCGRRSRAWIVQRDVNGRRHVQVTLGRWPETTAQDARARAHKVLAEMAAGIDPNKRAEQEARKQQEQLGSAITLHAALNLHVRRMQRREKSVRAIADLHAPIYSYMSDWLDLPLDKITRIMVYNRHDDISHRRIPVRTKSGALKTGGGPIAANRAMQGLRAAWNATRKIHPEVPEHAVHVDWSAEAEADDLLRIPLDALVTWRQEIDAQLTGARRDWVLTMLYTGLRDRDCASVRFTDVDFAGGTLARPEPKGGKKRAFVVPIAEQVLAIFQRRHGENRFEVEHDHGYVFPAHRHKFGEPCERCGGPCRITCVQVARLARHEYSVAWNPHALRRTFSAVADEIEVPEKLLAVLLNHKPDPRNMTQRYPGRPSDDRLRNAAQRIADALDERMQPANISRVAALASVRR